jgi:hypothetical protein
MTDAKKRAVEFVSTYIQDETRVNNFVLEKDMVSAYASAEVKIIQELEKAWYKDASFGDCYKVKIKAEVVPDTKAMEKMATGNPAAFDDPSAPLKVKAWTDKKVYKEGEKVKVYIKGNKPFYASVLYKDVSGAMISFCPILFGQRTTLTAARYMKSRRATINSILRSARPLARKILLSMRAHHRWEKSAQKHGVEFIR